MDKVTFSKQIKNYSGYTEVEGERKREGKREEAEDRERGTATIKKETLCCFN